MTAALRACIKDRSGTPAALAEVLHAISKEEGAYHEYLDIFMEDTTSELSNPMTIPVAKESGDAN